MKAAIYARVSTDKQTAENQLADLRKMAAVYDWTLTAEYIDLGISGAKDRHSRPQFDKLFQAIQDRRFDVVMGWSLDRLGRSVRDMAEFVEHLNRHKVDLYLHKERIDTTTPAGRLMFNVMASVAEFERERIRERVKAGIETARRKGKKLGRPKTAIPVERQIKDLRQQGMGILKIAKTVGVGTSVVQRVVGV